MIPPLPFAQLSPTIDAAQRIGNATPAVLLSLAVLGLLGAVVWLARENARLQEARRADTERLLEKGVERTERLDTAAQAMEAVPAAIEAQANATRAAVHTDITNEAERLRTAVTASITSVVDHGRAFHDGTRAAVSSEGEKTRAEVREFGRGTTTKGGGR